MRSPTKRSLCGLVLAFAGCEGSAGGPAGTGTDGGADRAADGGPDAPPKVAMGLEACFAAGGQLQELDVIDNSEVVDHGAISTIALSVASRIAVATADGAVKLWTIDGRDSEELTSGSHVTYGQPFGMGGHAMRAVEYFPDGIHLATGDEVGRLAVWDVDGRTTSATLDGPVNRIDAVAVSADGSTVMVGDQDPAGVVARLRTWTPETGAVSDPMHTALWNIWALRPLPGGGRLLAAGHVYSSPVIELHDLNRPTEVEAVWAPRLPPLDVGVTDIAVTRDGSTVVAVGGFVAVLDVETLATSEHRVIQMVDHQARSVALTPGDRFFVTLGEEGSVRLWDRTTVSEQGRMDLADPVSIRTDVRTDQLVVADRSGLVHLIGCAPAR